MQSSINCNYTIRPARHEDLEALVAIHVISWNATYPDHEPKPSKALRLYQWEKLFAEKKDNWFCYVAETVTGSLAGFVTGHDFNDPMLAYKGQLDKIHLLKQHQRSGLGRKLFMRTVHHFLDHDIHSMILFADPANAAIQFYDKLGGERLLDKEGLFQGAFGWKDIRHLVLQ
jgi:ribosomal protein S18 acetylase RimI-like enzyme